MIGYGIAGTAYMLDIDNIEMKKTRIIELSVFIFGIIKTQR